MRKCAHTYDTIISVENLFEAWSEFKRGKTKKVDVQEFERDLMSYILALHTELRYKTYRHGPYEHFVVNDPKRRDIHKATVRDRLLHHALHRVLYPHFDTKFIHDSYSCRVGKGTHRAFRQFELFSRKVSQNYTTQCWILKCDIRKFFSSIDHAVLMVTLRKHIEGEDVLRLLDRVIKSFHSGKAGKGLPLGNLTSQLLVNVYMNEFDEYVKRVLRQRYYIRYADDFVFFSESKPHLESVRQKCETFLTDRLRLFLHPDKVSISTIYSGIDFLGWVHFPRHRVLRTATKRRIFRQIAPQNKASYLGLLQHGNTEKVRQKLIDICQSREDGIN
jgi:RNA-directed DNA polymerase